MTSATDELHVLLDGLRDVYGLHAFAELFGFDWEDGSDWTWHDVACATADRIEATLGRGECEMEPLNAFFTTVNQLDQTVWGVCSNCGTASPIDATYCCECGRKVKR